MLKRRLKPGKRNQSVIRSILLLLMLYFVIDYLLDDDEHNNLKPVSTNTSTATTSDSGNELYFPTSFNCSTMTNNGDNKYCFTIHEVPKAVEDEEIRVLYEEEELTKLEASKEYVNQKPITSLSKEEIKQIFEDEELRNTNIIRNWENIKKHVIQQQIQNRISFIVVCAIHPNSYKEDVFSKLRLLIATVQYYVVYPHITLYAINFSEDQLKEAQLFKFTQVISITKQDNSGIALDDEEWKTLYQACFHYDFYLIQQQSSNLNNMFKYNTLMRKKIFIPISSVLNKGVCSLTDSASPLSILQNNNNNNNGVAYYISSSYVHMFSDFLESWNEKNNFNNYDDNYKPVLYSYKENDYCSKAQQMIGYTSTIGHCSLQLRHIVHFSKFTTQLATFNNRLAPKVATNNKQNKIKFCFCIATYAEQRTLAINEQSIISTFASFNGKLNHDLYDYHFYIGTQVDVVWDSKERREELIEEIKQSYHLLDNFIVIRYPLNKMLSDITWKFNMLINRAYNDNCDYMYQFSDDVIIHGDDKWTEAIVSQIESNGQIGSGGLNDAQNDNLMTLSLASRKHIAITGSYWPPRLKNWFSDNYMQYLYRNNLLFFLKNSYVENTQRHGQRYNGCEHYREGWESLLQAAFKLKHYSLQHNLPAPALHFHQKIEQAYEMITQKLKVGENQAPENNVSRINSTINYTLQHNLRCHNFRKHWLTPQVLLRFST